MLRRQRRRKSEQQNSRSLFLTSICRITCGLQQIISISMLVRVHLIKFWPNVFVWIPVALVAYGSLCKLLLGACGHGNSDDHVVSALCADEWDSRPAASFRWA
jgi:hypothetical protein